MDESGASLAAGARAGAEVFEKPSGDGNDDDGRRRRRVGRVCPFVSRSSLVDPPARLGRPTARSERREAPKGVGPVAGAL